MNIIEKRRYEFNKSTRFNKAYSDIFRRCIVLGDSKFEDIIETVDEDIRQQVKDTFYNAQKYINKRK